MVLTRVAVQLHRLVHLNQQKKQIFHRSLVLLTGRRLSTCNASFAVATDRRFTDKHEWVEVCGNVGTVGISQYAQDALGDVVYAQLPDVGTELEQGDECGALESVKAASELYSPVSGKVTEKNTEVESTPSLINTSCYEKGWLFKVDLKDGKEIESLMTEDKYKEYLKSAESH